MQHTTAALYLHVPFCHGKCRYCSFISTSPRDTGCMDAYLHQLRRELIKNAPAFSRYTIQSIFFGGGTPSVLPVFAVGDLLSLIRSQYRLSPDCEITCEANPESFLPPLADAWAEAGVNRVSFGCQAIQPSLLQLLGRKHTAKQAKQAVRTAQSAGISRINLDMIYALPTQTLSQWTDSLSFAMDCGVAHLSAYALSIEPNTPLYQDVQRGYLTPPEEDFAADCHDAIAPALAPYGLTAYEISNFAAPGQACRHNLLYWQNGVYLGCGPAAHSAFPGPNGEWTRAWNQENIASYLSSGPQRSTQTIGKREEMFETLMLATRTRLGLSLCAFEQRFGLPLEKVYPKSVQRCLSLGWAEIKNGFFSLTPKVWFLQNSVLQLFLEESPY